MLDPEVPQLGPVEAVALVEGGAFLLDVREDDEWAAGHAHDATHVRLSEVPNFVDQLPSDGRVVVAVCRAGGRSQQAAAFLRQQGIDAVNLVGGMRAWAAEGLDVVTDDGHAGTVI